MRASTRPVDILELLIGSPEDFFGTHWQTSPLHRAAAVAHGSTLMVSVDEFIHALSNPLLRAPHFLVTSDGQSVPPERISRSAVIGGVFVRDLADQRLIMAEFAEGATIVLRSMTDHIPRLAVPCAEIGRRFGSPVVAHLFVTPRSAPGFWWHRDTEDVIVVQTHGVKEWTLVPPDQVVGARGVLSPDYAPDPGDCLRYTLRPGDVLYIPSGCPHRARTPDTGESASVHLSLGIKLRTWSILGEDILRRALASSNGFAPRHPSAAQLSEWLTTLHRAATELVSEPLLVEPWQAPSEATLRSRLCPEFEGRTC